nr:vacuolar protein sorting-associated protein 13-like [Leptinotarsa decemlineata]
MSNSDRSFRNNIPLQEVCIISFPSVIVTIEAGVGNKTLPILMLEMGFRGCVRNWTSQLNIEASLAMQMGYYNSKLALWEPLIEPELRSSECIPWELKLELSMNQNHDDSSTMSPISEDEQELPQPLMSIDLISEKNVELTISKTLLENLKHLGNAFASAIDFKKMRHVSTIEAPYKIINEIGEDVTLLLGESSFELVEGGDIADINKSAAVPLQLRPEMKTEQKLYFGKKLESISSKKEHFLNMRVSY